MVEPERTTRNPMCLGAGFRQKRLTHTYPSNASSGLRRPSTKIAHETIEVAVANELAKKLESLHRKPPAGTLIIPAGRAELATAFSTDVVHRHK